jgi:thioesterase domain-containing protein/acyl carrier protein
LRSYLKQKLPDYLVPAAFVLLAELPLTPNGKVDRRALPKLDDFGRDLEGAYAAPRDNLERQLANIWEKLLNVKPVGVNDSFFEMGGHSLLAVCLFAQIENRFGKHLPLATLFQSPTIEQLANVLREAEVSKTWSSLVAIQPLGFKPPLFCVHAAGANVLIYRPLSRHLGNDQPLYALQAQGLDGNADPFTRIEEMATHYIEEMRAFQPEGPYFLLGASFGGLVIYEMAHQLLAQGQEVALMAMLNTNCPVYTLAKRIRTHFGHLAQSGPGLYAREVAQALRRRMGKKSVSNGDNIVHDAQLRQLIERRRDGDEALVKTVLAILQAEREYLPAERVYPGKITLFWADAAPRDFEDNRLGWRNLAAGGLEVHVVPGTHTSIREEPNVMVLVDKLKPCLERAQL